jgi:Ca-activated chloride channel family protein
MWYRALALGLVFLLPVTVFPQEKPAEPSPIRVQVNEVIVPVTVTDEKGRFVSDLVKDDFHVFDDGKPQTISYFTHDHAQPVVAGFLVDQSNAMKIHWAKYQDALTELVQNLLPGDKKFAGYLITYGNTAELQVDTSSDPEKMIDKITKMKPGGGSAMFDAVYAACTSRKLVNGEPYEPRRVIIIIGDGHDTASKRSLAEVLEVAQRNLVTIYGMSTQAFGFKSEGDDNLVRLCEETGGRVEYPLDTLYKDISGYLSKPSDDGNYAIAVGTGGYTGEISGNIFHSIAEIAGEITTQYILRYTPDAAANEKPKVFHTIRIQVNLPNVKVRYRKGYYPLHAAPYPTP